MDYFFAELDTANVKDVTLVSRQPRGSPGGAEQRVFLNSDGMFRFDDMRAGAVKVMRLPVIKLQVFCALVCDMLALEEDMEEMDGSWSILARDRHGRRYRADGFAVSFLHRPKHDPSLYLRNATGIREMWLLDGKA